MLGGIDTLVATCSCPMRYDCKHTVALILTMRSPAQHRTAPTWQQILSPFAGTASVTGKPLALQVTEEGANLALRPLRKGARGNWVRTGATWDEVATQGGDFVPVQRDALLALLECRTGGPFRPRTDSLLITDLLPAFWPALRRAVDAGVALVAGTSVTGRDLPDPTLSPDPFEPIAAILPGPAGSLTVDPMLSTPLGVIPLPRGPTSAGPRTASRSPSGTPCGSHRCPARLTPLSRRSSSRSGSRCPPPTSTTSRPGSCPGCAPG
ncbi:SWIM zinc finger family protein [Tessaracoccus aquimaris]|uniref:SWIM zinc finger family protein n=1 Tax=Tessaracoccus aquimaris TaxID=1332264 RepID=UPI000988B795|nr:SWIM zinc finger family protein [Tessaracoccus aquimaris]